MMRSSPTEQGELSPSPAPMDADDRGDGESLDIKPPPQAGIGRSNARHKRKRRRKDRKDRLGRIGSGAYSRPLAHRDAKGLPSKSSQQYDHYRPGSSRDDYRKDHGIRDARSRLDAVRGITDAKKSSRSETTSWSRSYDDRRRHSSRDRHSDDRRHRREEGSSSHHGRSGDRESSRRGDSGERSTLLRDRSRSPVSSHSARDGASSSSRNTKRSSLMMTSSATGSRPSSQHTTPKETHLGASKAVGMSASLDATPTQDEQEDRRARGDDDEHRMSGDEQLSSAEDETDQEGEAELPGEEEDRGQEEEAEDDASSSSDGNAGSGTSGGEQSHNEEDYEEGSEKASYEDELDYGGEHDDAEQREDEADGRLPFQPRSKFESDHSESSSGNDDGSDDQEGDDDGHNDNYEQDEREVDERDDAHSDGKAAEESGSDADSVDSNGDRDEEPEAIYENEQLPTPAAPSPPKAKPAPSKPALPPYYPAIQGCRNVDEFKCLNRIEEGTYGVVYRAEDLKKAEIVALKRLKMEKEKEGFPITSLREINTLLKAQHPNVVHVREIVVGSNMDKIYLVMDFVEHDLKSLMENMKQPFLVGEVKTLLKQLLAAVAHLHDNWILHRDLKTSNLLLSHKGILKVGDFGLAREYGSPLKAYTPIVVTLWYRAPELLLGCKYYSTPVDMWSVGCIFAEFLNMKPLWPGKSENDQLNKIFQDLGSPNENIWPGVMELPVMKKCTFAAHPYNNLRARFTSLLSNNGYDLLNRFLTYNPAKRISSDEAAKHDYFRESPLPIDPSMFPTWPAKSEQPRKRGSTPRPPSGGGAYKLLGDNDDEAMASAGFHMSGTAKGVSAVGHGFSLRF